MLNREKYAKEIVDITLVGGHIAIKNNKPVICDGTDCSNCLRDNGEWECDKDRGILRAWANSEYRESILSEEEKKYLSMVIKPFRNNIKYAIKEDIGFPQESYIRVRFCMEPSNICIPQFKGSTDMYKGMELNKRYSLEELQL